LSKIIKLDKKLSNQISAWEVVERPVSVVKELVENSIDAWSTEIKVEILNWWIDEIIITDNWEWIEKNDFSLVLEKYSTSKIKSIEDLHNVMTFWFRWEALASISSISNFQLISKTKNEDFWNILTMFDWEKSEIKSFPSENGTKIIVSNLFLHTPARLNYLKKSKTEYSYILEFLNQISLSYPHIWFEFISDNKSIFKYKKNEDLKTRIYSIFWEDFYNNLIELDYKIPWVHITWFISDPKISFWNKNRQVLFVNNRIIKSPIIFKSIIDSYNRFIPHSNFPWYVLNIKVDPTQVDVNVHPRKMEVRFADEQSIFRWIYHSILSKLEKVTLINNNNVEKPIYGVPEYSVYEENNALNKNVTNNLSTKENQPYYVWSWNKFKSYSPYKDISSNPNQVKIPEIIDFSKSLLWYSNEIEEENIEKNDFNQSDLHYTAIWKIIWQTFNSYIIIETNNSLKILDQHALAERIIYEKLVNNQYKEKTQKLLIWESITLTPEEFSILEQEQSIFIEMWFDFEFSNWNKAILLWIPDFIKKDNIINIFMSIIDDINNFKSSNNKTLQEVRNKIFAYTACRSAIKFWNKLNLFEINKLLNDSIIDYSSTCPHWRPVIYEINLEELKWKYER